MRKSAMIFMGIFLLVVSAMSVGAAKTRIFTTFDTTKRIGMFYFMNFDGSSYWFSSMLGGATLRYDPITKESKRFSFNREETVESVTGIVFSHVK